MQILPITNNVNQVFSTVLNGTELKFRCWYQDVGEGWYFSVEFANGDKIKTGVRMNSEAPFFESTLTDFGGDILPLPTITPGAELGLEPWGNTHLLVYFTPDEIADFNNG